MSVRVMMGRGDEATEFEMENKSFMRSNGRENERPINTTEDDRKRNRRTGSGKGDLFHIYPFFGLLLY